MSLLKKIIPAKFKHAVRSFIKKEFRLNELKESTEAAYREIGQRRIREEAQIPKIELQQKHIKNLKVLLDRSALLKEMPNGGICAEIGVNEGEFSKHILDITKPAKLHLIDAWGDNNRYHDGLKLTVKDKFDTEIKEGKVEINVGYSTDVLKTFPDNYFDWVYLDTDHSYKTTSAELAILKNKVKPDGIISGHDYTIGNWIGNYRYGVIEAVHELCVLDGWELTYLTNETHQCRNFAIRKIK